MVTTQTTKPPTVIHAICTKSQRGSWLGTPEEHSQVHPIPEENATSGISIADEVVAVHTSLQKISNNKIHDTTLYKTVTQNGCRKIGTRKCKYQKYTHSNDKSFSQC